MPVAGWGGMVGGEGGQAWPHTVMDAGRPGEGGWGGGGRGGRRIRARSGRKGFVSMVKQLHQKKCDTGSGVWC